MALPAATLARLAHDDLEAPAETLIEETLADAGEHRVDDDVAVVLIGNPVPAQGGPRR